MLWLDEHKPEERDDFTANKRILAAGNAVGDLAMGYYGDFTEVPYNEDKGVMLAETSRLFALPSLGNAKSKTICEASFSFDGNFCSVDILRVFEDGGKPYVEITEVKSSTDIKQIYYDEAAFQYFVLTSSGFDVRKVSILYVNKEYVQKKSPLDLQSFFTLHNCTEKIRAKQKEVTENIAKFKAAGETQTEISTDIGEQCFDPRECEYRAYCWRHIPEKSVFDIAGNALRRDKKFDFYRRGIVSFEQLLASGEEINAAARLQVETELERKAPVIDKAALNAFFDTLRRPLYFLDFETIQEAVPPYEGMKPYAQLPVQYSLHIQEKQGGALSHLEFLAEPGIDPRLSFAEKLCADIPEDSCVIAYNAAFEKGRIKELADYVHDISHGLAAHLLNIRGNIKDLMRPFQSRAYYSMELEGSYSIKKVLPALCSGDSELDYKALPLVHSGGEAMDAYAELRNAKGGERERIRTGLLAYCRLDTLAMVKILEKLKEETR